MLRKIGKNRNLTPCDWDKNWDRNMDEWVVWFYTEPFTLLVYHI